LEKILGRGEDPGQTALQVMFCAAVASTTARVKPISAVLVVTQSTRSTTARRPKIEATLNAVLPFSIVPPGC
jgi:hypothetical protein